MKKNILTIIAMLLAVSLLAGCAGTTVVVNETKPAAAATEAPKATEAAAEQTDGTTSATESVPVKTGICVSTNISESTSAADGQEGVAKFDVTIAAVTVDDKGVIRACKIDGIPASVKFDTTGAIVSDTAAEVLTKNEKGADYGMVAYGGAIAEWDAQVAALCDYAVGKTVEELKNGAIDASGKTPEGSDLASSATIYLGGYVSAIEAAVNNAADLGAKSGDTLALVTVNSLGKSAAATAEKDGAAQLEVDIAAVTSWEGVISSCIIDAVQAKVSFDTTGTITTDLTVPVQTKNEKGADYGMVAYGGATAEWNEQAASFAAYVTGKTAEEVAGIAVSEGKPTDADLASSVTIRIGPFQALIAKALG